MATWEQTEIIKKKKQQQNLEKRNGKKMYGYLKRQTSEIALEKSWILLWKKKNLINKLNISR